MTNSSPDWDNGTTPSDTVFHHNKKSYTELQLLENNETNQVFCKETIIFFLIYILNRLKFFELSESTYIFDFSNEFFIFGIIFSNLPGVKARKIIADCFHPACSCCLKFEVKSKALFQVQILANLFTYRDVGRDE